MLSIILQTVTAHFFHSGMSLTEPPESFHLVGRVGLADLTHREAHMDQHPIARHRGSILQKAQIHLAPHAHDINEGLQPVLRVDLDNLSWYR
jgi:hypothetical protein